MPKVQGARELTPFAKLEAGCNKLKIQGDFFNWASPENVSRLAPPKNASTGPPYFEKVLSNAGERGDIPNTLTFPIPMGGQSGTLTFFLNQLLTGQHLANSGEAQLKKSPCIMHKNLLS